MSEAINKIRSLFGKKSKPVERIMAIKVGAKDFSDSSIIHVLVKHDEFAIYEIDTPDINNRVRTIIDGRTDKSEKEIQNRFNKVKQKYIQAIGMLPNSPNTEMLKRRIAHTLSSCLSGDTDGIKEFENLITTIQNEHEKLVLNRLLYLAPTFLSTFIVLGILVPIESAQNLLNFNISNPMYFLYILLATFVGASISILINASKLNFEEYLSSKYYFFLGFERVLLSLFAGCAAFICIKAGVLFPKIIDSSLWGIMSALVIVGFSESLIPSFLSKTDQEK